VKFHLFQDHSADDASTRRSDQETGRGEKLENLWSVSWTQEAWEWKGIFFFSCYNELQKHWLLQSSGLNTMEATKNTSEWDDTQNQDRIVDTPMPYVTRNRGHRDLLMRQIVQICIYLPWPLCTQPWSDWSKRGESLNLITFSFEDWVIVFPVKWFSCQFVTLWAKAHTSGERRTPGCN